MKFRFNEERAAQAAAYLVWRHGGEHDYLSVLKLLYLTNRASLIEIGVPITGDQMMEMKLGPILSQVMDRLNGTVTSETWHRHVTAKDDQNRVRLTTDDDQFGALSDHDIAILERIDDSHGDKTPTQLIDFCHELPELEGYTQGSHTIFPEKVLRRAKVPDEKVRRLQSHAKDHWRTLESPRARSA